MTKRAFLQGALLTTTLLTGAASASASNLMGAPEYVSGDCAAVSHWTDGRGQYNLYYDSLHEHSEGDRETKLRTCEYRTKVKVPAGWRVAMEKVGYKGYRTMKDGDIGAYVAKTWMKHASEPTTYEMKKVTKLMTKPTTNEMWYMAYGKSSDFNWSRCGEDVYIHTLNATLVYNKWSGDTRPYVGVTKAQYQLKWERCGAGDEPPVEIPADEAVDEAPFVDNIDADDPAAPPAQDNGVDLDNDGEIDAEGEGDNPLDDIIRALAGI